MAIRYVNDVDHCGDTCPRAGRRNAHLKTTYPDRVVFVSMTGINLIPGYTEAEPDMQAQALADVIDHTDWLGLPLYPYIPI